MSSPGEVAHAPRPGGTTGASERSGIAVSASGAGTGHRAPSRRRWPWRKRLATLATVLFLAVWAFLFWPTTLGGRTAYVIVHGTSMQPMLHTDDLVLVRKHAQYNVGDLVAFDIQGGHVIHRLYSGNDKTGFRTKGDNRTGPDPWTITPNEVIGEQWIVVPKVGWLVKRFQYPAFTGMVVAALIVMASDAPKKGRRRATQPAEA